MPITHEWNGTILTITSDSGTSSCDLKGDKGDDGARGPQGVAGDCVATDTAMLGGIPATDYALKSDIPNGVDLSDYYTKTETETAIDNAKPDLTEYAKKSDTVANAEKLGGKEPKYYIQPYNLLDNSNYEIAQAGYGGYHGSELFVADRWEGAFTTSTFTRTADGVSHYASNEDSYSFIFQKLFGDGREKGKTYTFAITLANGDIRTATGTFPVSDVSTQTTIATVIVKENCKLYMLKDTDGYIRLRIDLTQPNAYVEFLNVAFYEGEYTAETLPPYVPKGYAVELAECQRYYYRIDSLLLAGYGFVGTDGYTVHITIPTPQKMRVSPSITHNGTLRIYGVDGYVDVSSYTVQTYGTGGVRITLSTGGVVWTVGSPCVMYAMGGIALSADL